MSRQTYVLRADSISTCRASSASQVNCTWLSAASRQTMKSFLYIVAGMLSFTSMQSCAWGTLRRHHIRGGLEMLQVSGRAPTPINTYRSALKGTAREAWMLKQMGTESYQQILSVRGSRLTRGRALAPAEIRALFRSCEQDVGFRGPRDAAMLAVCAAKKSFGWTMPAPASGAGVACSG